MKKTLIILYFFLPLIVYGSGESDEIEMPEVYTVIDVKNSFAINNGNFLDIELNLPYTKPEGVTRIFHPAASYMEGILVERLIVDGSPVKVRGGYHGYDPSDIIIVPVDVEEQRQLFLYRFEYERGKSPHIRSDFWDFDPETAEKTPMLGYVDSTTVVNRPRFARKLLIPIDAQEAYMTYRIVFPDGRLSDSETVYWEFDWPEDFGRD